MPLSSKSLEHEYFFNLTFTIHVHVIKLGGNLFTLMPGQSVESGRISAFALIPGQIGQVQYNLYICIDAQSNQSSPVELVHLH